MQKRTALARALVDDPQIVLFTELITGQDGGHPNVEQESAKKIAEFMQNPSGNINLRAKLKDPKI